MAVLPARRPDPLFLDHALAINDILVRVEVFCRDHPDKWKLVHLEHDRDLKARKLNLPLVPDGFFEVGFLETRESFPILLEMDMDTEEKPRWVDKIEKYLNLFGKEAERAFGFRHPTLLSVTLTEKHARELKRWTEETIYKRGWDDHDQLFFFTWFEKGMDADKLLFTPRYLVGGRDDPVYLFAR
jgi:hypothetical protein